MTTEVFINGDAYVGWKGLTIDRSIEDAVSTCSFTSPLRWPNDPNPTRVRPGDLIQVHDDGEQMFYGYADVPQIDSETDGHTVAIDARSATSDLVDCSVVTEPYAWKQKTMLEIANLITLPYRVPVLDYTLADEVIGRPIDFRTELGEFVFDAIERMAQDAGVLVTDDGDGNIVLTKARSVFGLLDERIGLPVIEYGVNTASASGVFRHDQRYSEYWVFGQRPGNNADSGAAVALQRVIVGDPEVQRTRILSIQSTQMATLEQLKARGAWEAVTRAGRSVSLTYGMVGWRRPDGKLWAPGQLVTVRDKPRAVNATMVIASVSWTDASDSKGISVTVAPPEGFELMPTVMPNPATGVNVLSKPITPGSKFGVWLTDADVKAIKARSGK